MKKENVSSVLSHIDEKYINEAIEEQNRVKKVTRRRVIVLLTILVLTSCIFATFAISFITKPVPDVSENTGSEDGSLSDASASTNHNLDSINSNNNQSDSGAWFSKDESEEAGSSGDVTIDNSQDHSETSAEMSEDNVSRHEESSKAQHGDTSAEGSDDISDTGMPDEISDSNDVPVHYSEDDDPLEGNDPYTSLIDEYEEFMETKANGKRVLKIRYLEDQLPITSFCRMGDSYSIGGLTIYDEGVINGEEDLLRYHASLIGASGPEVIGIYDSDEKLSELNFTDQYRIYCRTYIKEGIKIYAMSYKVIPYDGYIGYDLYFCINGVWMKLNANGYYYPGANGILRAPNEWPEGIKYVTDALVELSDVSNDDSSLILALQLALS